MDRNKRTGDSLEETMKECRRLKGRLEVHLDRLSGEIANAGRNGKLKEFFTSKSYSQIKATIQRFLNSFRKSFGNYQIYERRLNDIIFELEESVYADRVTTMVPGIRAKREPQTYNTNMQGGFRKLVDHVTPKTSRY